MNVDLPCYYYITNIGIVFDTQFIYLQKLNWLKINVEWRHWVTESMYAKIHGFRYSSFETVYNLFSEELWKLTTRKGGELVVDKWC